MVARPTVAIDLPLKALAWEDVDGKVWLTYNTVDLLHERHGLPKELAAKLDPQKRFTGQIETAGLELLVFVMYLSPLLIVVLDKTTGPLSSNSTNESFFPDSARRGNL